MYDSSMYMYNEYTYAHPKKRKKNKGSSGFPAVNTTGKTGRISITERGGDHHS